MIEIGCLSQELREMGASPELGAAHQPLTKELTSWKEVACYLDVSTRTA